MTRVLRPTSGFKAEATERLQQELPGETRRKGVGPLLPSDGFDISLPSDIAARLSWPVVDTAREVPA